MSFFSMSMGTPGVPKRGDDADEARQGATHARPLLKAVGETEADMDDDPEICVAARAGDFELVQQLIASNSQLLEQVDAWGNGPLHWACLEGHPEVVTWLLRRGAERSRGNAGGYTPLHWAALRGDRGQHHCIEALLTVPPDDQEKADALAQAAAGQSPCPKQNCRHYMNHSLINPSSGWSPVLHASSNGHLASLTCFLDHGVHPNLKNKAGFAPLHWAAGEGHLDCVKLLVDRGGDIHDNTTVGFTPLQMAARWDRDDVFALLLEQGCDPSTRTSDGRFTSMIARPKCLAILKALEAEKKRQMEQEREHLESQCSLEPAWARVP